MGDEKDAVEVNTKIYARVRRLMPWEPKKVSLKVMGDKVQNKTDKIVNEYDFDRVFDPNVENHRVYQTVVTPMISNVLKGFNALLIAYGQTGSGKTYSMLGKPKLGIVGLLPMMLENVANQPSVTSVELSGVEAFGHHVNRIVLYDLFNPNNQTPSWDDKTGNTSLEMSDARTVTIADATDAHDKIVYAHDASHFAPTGKNPESSRGHVTFVAKITQQKSRHESIVSYFVMVDCAGSEGESAFTQEFKDMVDKATLMARRLEAGCINTGLSALQIIFNELRVRNELSATVGNGLRRVLHPYINTQTFLAVLFNLSPSINNSRSTESTLKFAVTAGMVKVKPVQTKRSVNLESLIAELRTHIDQQEKMINDNVDKIEELQRDIEYTKNPRGKRPRGNRGGGDGDDDGEYEDGDYDDGYDDDYKESGGISLAPIQVANTGGREHRNSTEVLQQLDILNDVGAELEDLLMGGDGNIPSRTGRAGSVITAEDNERAMAQALDDARQTNIQRQVEQVIEQSSQQDEVSVMALDTTEDYIRLKEVEVQQMDEDGLRGYAMEVTSLYDQERIIHDGLAQSQQVIVEYLQEEYEGLLKYFQVRKILPKPPPRPSSILPESPFAHDD